MKFLPEADALQELGLITELFFMAAYGYILFTAAVLIGDGSERLLLLYGPGVVGGLVIPILGAIPDGAIIFFSGFGTDKAEVQEKIAVGVGTLVGSTVMLITLPFAATIWLGSRKLNADGTVNEGAVRPAKWTSMQDGIRVEDNLPMSSYIMMATSLTFLIIQIPAFWYISDKADRASGEHTPALIGLCVATLSFIGYSVYQLTSAASSERQKEKESEARMAAWKRAMRGRFTQSNKIVELIFHKFDTDKTGTIEPNELKDGLESLGLKLDRKDLIDFMEKYDVDQSFSISMDEFEKLAQDVFFKQMHSNTNLLSKDLIGDGERNGLVPSEIKLVKSKDKANFGSVDENNVKVNLEQFEEAFSTSSNMDVNSSGQHVTFSDDESDEEEFLEMTDSQLRNKALLLLAAGTLLVTVFSDPMVEAISAFAGTTGIPAFYVSFVVTPLASNAAEVLASLRFATKKSVNCVTLSLSSLYGAACMNNTFCLGIFFALIWLQNLEWDFTAETITNLTVIWLVGLSGTKPYYRNWQGWYIASLYIVAIVMIVFLTFLDK